jgi:hemoglobin
VKESVMEQSLYQRLGGSPAIVAVIDDFVSRCAADARINQKFVRTDVPRLKAMLVDQVTAATGGPATYSGRSMEETHRGMGVTAGEFDALVADLVATLDGFSVPAAEQQELLGILGPLRGDIVEIESPATGTPLPASYQTAAPLART